MSAFTFLQIVKFTVFKFFISELKLIWTDVMMPW